MAKKSQKYNLMSAEYLKTKYGWLLAAITIFLVGILTFNFLGKLNPSTPQPKQEIQTNESEEPALKKFESSGEKIATQTYHTVKSGESLSEIALRYYGTPFRWQEIAQSNKLSNPKIIHAGNVLLIPAGEIASAKTEVSNVNNTTILNQYTVKGGDTLWDIAVKTYGDGFAWTKIAQANKLANPNVIHAGNVLTLPR